MAATTPFDPSSPRSDRCGDLSPGPASLAFVTPCAAVKDTTARLLPAIERYRSRRIPEVQAAASDLGVDFLIFSGEFGLLEASTLIPYYDHLLLLPEVKLHATRVARQLRQRQVDRILFFSDSPEADPLLLPYLSCLELAADEAGVAVTFLTFASLGEAS